MRLIRSCLLLLGILCLSSIIGCSEPTEQATKQPKVESIVLRFGHDMPKSSPQHEAAIKFADLVAEKSKGQLKIDIYPAQSLGSDRKMLNMAQKGELDIILPPTAKLSHIIPQLQIFDLPYLFPDAQTAYRALDGHPGNKLLALFEAHDLIGITIWESGFKQLTSAKPITKVEDFKAQKFRIMESQLLQDQFAFWGANSMVIDFGKTYDVLKDGVVDGQENPLNAIVNMGFNKVQKHLYLTDHGYLPQVMAISKITFNKLSKAHQQIVKDAAVAITPWQREQSKIKHTALLAQLQNSSIQISKLPEPVTAFMQQQARALLEKYRMHFSTELIEDILQINDSQRTFTDDQLVLAIDADMQGNSALSGLAIRRGVELAIDEINAAGGVLGKKLTLTVRDNSMIPARGLDNLQKFAAIDNLLAVYTGISSPVVLAELNYIHQNKILTLDPWAAATPIIDNGQDPNYVFRVSVRDEYAADFLLKSALEVSTNVGLLLVDNGWGRSNHKALISSLNKQGLKPTTTQWFEWGKKDFSDSLAHLFETGSEVIIYVGNPVEANKFVTLMSENANPLPIISHWGITGGYFAKNTAQALKKVDLRILQTFSFVNNSKPKVKAFIEKYKSKYSVAAAQDIVAPVGTAHAYDLTHLLIKAVNLAGSSDMEKVRAAMETIKRHQGLVKDYNPPFTKTNHDALDGSDFILTRYQDNYLVPFKN